VSDGFILRKLTKKTINKFLTQKKGWGDAKTQRWGDLIDMLPDFGEVILALAVYGMCKS
jgi:hypothetical protein